MSDQENEDGTVLTEREQYVLNAVAAGKSRWAIAMALDTSPDCIKVALCQARKKAGIVWRPETKGLTKMQATVMKLTRDGVPDCLIAERLRTNAPTVRCVRYAARKKMERLGCVP